MEQGLSKRAKIQNYIYMILNFPVLDFLSSEDKSMMMFFYIKKRNIYFFQISPFELASSRQNQGGRKQILYGGTTKKIEF